jgi:hypothetical protein
VRDATHLLLSTKICRSVAVCEHQGITATPALLMSLGTGHRGRVTLDRARCARSAAALVARMA